MNKIKKMLQLFCMLFLALIMVSEGVQAATTDPLNKMPKNTKIIIGTWEALEVAEPTVGTFQTPEYNSKVNIKATSSNENIAIVVAYPSEFNDKCWGVYSVRNLKNKPGKVNITVTVKVNGKKL